MPWSRLTPLMVHQQQAVDKLAELKVGALFMEMGTGKTLTAIDLACRRQARIDRVIWFCPVAVKRTIYRQILRHTSCSSRDIHVFDESTREDRLPACTWYVVGIESMGSSARMIHAVAALISTESMVVVDESSYIKGPFAKRTDTITKLARHCRYRMILNGTPITQGVVDLYSQMTFLSPKILGYVSYYSFAANHLVLDPKHPGRIFQTFDTGYLAKRIAPYAFQVRKLDCLDLPPESFDAGYCDLTAEQRERYEAAKVDWLNELGDTPEFTGRAIFRLFTRLQCIVCGFDGVDQFPHRRLDAMEAMLSGVDDSHLVIWAKYLLSVDQIAAWAAAQGRRHWIYDGRIGEAARDERHQAWTAEGGLLIATQSVGGHGVDFTAASTAVFYSNSFKYSERHQAQSRIHRRGQERPVIYLDLWSNSGIEQRMEKALRRKANVLQAFQRDIERVQGVLPERVTDFVMRL